MGSQKEHYDKLLAKHYTWMCGDFSEKVTDNREFFESRLGANVELKLAVDLGCGSGFQSCALAELGCEVLAIDTSEKLLAELDEMKDDLDIKSIYDDLLLFPAHLNERKADAIACMGDTLTHLESKADVEQLLGSIAANLNHQGHFFLTYRDLSFELDGVDRIIPLKTDDSRLMSTFLEYEDATVVVNDMIWQKQDDVWALHKSSYRKLRLPVAFIEDVLKKNGFELVMNAQERGLIKIHAVKKVV